MAPSPNLLALQQIIAGNSADPRPVALLERHIGERARGQQLIASDEPGQGMAEAIARGSNGIDFRALVDLVRFNDAASISVLETAADGGLTSAQKWNVIKVNADFLRYLVPGLTINKIIPDAQVSKITKDGKLTDFGSGNAFGGSVAHEINYQGLTGEQSVSNFGLDYGGYTDTDSQGNLVRLVGGNATADFSQGQKSSYVRAIPGGVGPEQLEAVKNVFYLNIKLPAENIPNVKIPIHQSIIDYALLGRTTIAAALADAATLRRLVDERAAGNGDVLLAYLLNKADIIERFLKVALFSPNMAVSKNLEGKRNEQDPLTNLGITKPGSRLTNKFGTINQEYHIDGYFPLPADSGLFLKDSTGQDVKVGSFLDVNGQLMWVNLDLVRINAALAQNDAFRA